jgi:NADP-dependent 3-hydroxy acid dehydrogenase YdfG
LVASSFLTRDVVVSLAGRDLGRLEAVTASVPPDLLRGVRRHDVLDVSDWDLTGQWISSLVEDHGRVDLVLNLVGGWAPSGLAKGSQQVWEAMVGNLAGSVASLARASAAPLTVSDGVFAMVSSPVSDRVTAGSAGYSAAKAAGERWAGGSEPPKRRAGTVRRRCWW